jgi:hypothetical protein
VADFVCTRQFLKELSEFEKSASTADRRNLEQTLAAIVNDARLPRRVASFYEPILPSYLYRSGNTLMHYRTSQQGGIEFLNLLWPRV